MVYRFREVLSILGGDHQVLVGVARGFNTTGLVGSEEKTHRAGPPRKADPPHPSGGDHQVLVGVARGFNTTGLVGSEEKTHRAGPPGLVGSEEKTHRAGPPIFSLRLATSLRITVPMYSITMVCFSRSLAAYNPSPWMRERAKYTLFFHSVLSRRYWEDLEWTNCLLSSMPGSRTRTSKKGRLSCSLMRQR
ncbi:hypothetical protein CRUP_018804 [Coryphaenoides rupestris]|nr:hypothetical protein CRUP_018804 [Coryphaenoides rupestris]